MRMFPKMSIRFFKFHQYFDTEPKALCEIDILSMSSPPHRDTVPRTISPVYVRQGSVIHFNLLHSPWTDKKKKNVLHLRFKVYSLETHIKHLYLEAFERL